MLFLHTEADAGKARHPESAATWTGVPERYIAIEPASKLAETADGVDEGFPEEKP